VRSRHDWKEERTKGSWRCKSPCRWVFEEI